MEKAIDPPTPSVRSPVGVQFKTAGPIFAHDRGRLVLSEGDLVVVEAERGTALGTVTAPSAAMLKGAERPPRVLRKADPRDLARDELNKQREREALHLCLRRIGERKMSMKIVGVRYQFDGERQSSISPPRVGSISESWYGTSPRHCAPASK